MKKLYVVLFVLNFFICMAGCATMNENETVFFYEISKTSIKVELIIEKFSLSEKELKISLKVTNLIDKDIALATRVLRAFDSGETNWDIIVTNEQGEEIDYLGRLVSMLPVELTIDECTILKSGETLIIECPNLYDNYDFDSKYSDTKYEELNFYYFGYLGKSNIVTIRDFD